MTRQTQIKLLDFGEWLCKALLITVGMFGLCELLIPQPPPQPIIPPAPVQPDCIVVKPAPSCRVFEQTDFDRLVASKAITDAQRRLAHSGMAPMENTKLPPGRLYYATASGDLVEAKTGPGVWVDAANDPSNPVVRAH